MTASPLPTSIEQLAQEYRAGATIGQLSEKHRVPRHRLSTELFRHGVKIRKPGVKQISDATYAQVVEAYVAGMPIVEIVVTFNVSTAAIYSEITRRGVPRRNAERYR